MKKIILSLVLCFGFVGSVVAGDGFDVMENRPFGLTQDDFHKICSEGGVVGEKLCYAYVRGLFDGNYYGRAMQTVGLKDVCIPENQDYHTLTKLMVEYFKNGMAKAGSDTPVGGTFYIVMTGETLCSLETSRK